MDNLQISLLTFIWIFSNFNYMLGTIIISFIFGLCQLSNDNILCMTILLIYKKYSWSGLIYLSIANVVCVLYIYSKIYGFNIKKIVEILMMGKKIIKNKNSIIEQFSGQSRYLDYYQSLSNKYDFFINKVQKLLFIFKKETIDVPGFQEVYSFLSGIQQYVKQIKILLNMGIELMSLSSSFGSKKCDDLGILQILKDSSEKSFGECKTSDELNKSINDLNNQLKTSILNT